VRLSVKAEIAQRKAEGNFFKKDPTKTMMGNALDLVEWLAAEGTKQVSANLPADADFHTGHLEGMTYRRVQMVTGKKVQSRFGKSHVFGASRGTRPLRGSLSSEDEHGRNPYLQLSVIERDKGIVRRAYNRMRAYERSVRKDMTEGLN